MDRQDLFRQMEKYVFNTDPLGRVAWKKIDFLVKLHDSVEKTDADYCFECDVVYPCPTIRLIESDLE